MNDVTLFTIFAIILLIPAIIVGYLWCKHSDAWVRVAGIFYTVVLTIMGLITIYVTMFGDK